jgi:hypothetical protein
MNEQTRKVIQQALEWIEAQPEPRMIGAASLIAALRQLLGPAPVQEPVAMTEELATLLSSVNGDCYIGKEKEENLVYVVRRQYSTPPAQPEPVQEPLHDEEVRLIAHNECPEDWDSLDNKEYWLKGFVSGFKTAELERKT